LAQKLVLIMLGEGGFWSILGGLAGMGTVRYDTIEGFNVDSKAEYTA